MVARCRLWVRLEAGSRRRDQLVKVRVQVDRFNGPRPVYALAVVRPGLDDGKFHRYVRGVGAVDTQLLQDAGRVVDKLPVIEDLDKLVPILVIEQVQGHRGRVVKPAIRRAFVLRVYAVNLDLALDVQRRASQAAALQGSVDHADDQLGAVDHFVGQRDTVRRDEAFANVAAEEDLGKAPMRGRALHALLFVLLRVGLIHPDPSRAMDPRARARRRQEGVIVEVAHGFALSASTAAVPRS